MNKRILFLIFSLTLFSIFILTLNQLKTIEGEVDDINYKSFGIIIEIDNNEYIILENRIINLLEGDSVKIIYSEQEYNSESEYVIEKITKF